MMQEKIIFGGFAKVIASFCHQLLFNQEENPFLQQATAATGANFERATNVR